MSTIFDSGKQHIGFNYWASNAGTNMWHDWDESVVEKDVKGLASAGATVLRVFPMWKDFQPITLHKACFGKEKVVYFREQPLGFDELGQAGLDPVMMERFRRLTEICARYDIRLIVGILTGWMSGRLLVPDALEGKNVITDPFCIYWETKFVESFVRYFKDCPAIAAWELGNETNCMGLVDNAYQAWHWSDTIASAIRKADRTRPVVSGMHSLTPNDNWSMQHQGEVCDILTIHPYPVFTPYCDLDPHITVKPVMHLAAELCFYRDIGKKPCFTEEIGTTDMRISEENNCRFIRTNLYSALAYNGFPFLWWCGCYEKELSHAPYSWGHGERGMGLLLPDGEKPALNEFRKFMEICAQLPGGALPERKTEVHGILSSRDSWAAWLGGFILAMQSGFDFSCQYHDQALADAGFYFCPSYESSGKEEWERLLEKVRDGASLFISSDVELGSDYREVFGFEYALLWRQAGRYVRDVSCINSATSKKLIITTAQVLLRDENGEPLLIKNAYGKGTAYFCPAALEQDYARRSGVAYQDSGKLHREVYRIMAEEIRKDRVLRKEHTLTGVTEHPYSDTKLAAVVVNYDTADVTEHLKVKDGYRIVSCLGAACEQTGNDAVLALPGNDGCVLLLERENG